MYASIHHQYQSNLAILHFQVRDQESFAPEIEKISSFENGGETRNKKQDVDERSSQVMYGFTFIHYCKLLHGL